MVRNISNKRRKQIARAAQKAAKKQKAKKGSVPNKLTIQTSSIGKRLLVGSIGLALVVLSIYLMTSFIIEALAVVSAGLVILVLAFVGKRKTIEGAFNGIDAGISDKILEGILDSIF